MDQKLNNAPIKHVNRALDAGCGTGIWAIDFGTSHLPSQTLQLIPSSRRTPRNRSYRRRHGSGTASQVSRHDAHHSHKPTSSPLSVPPNLNFEIDDLEQDWTFSRKFNYIHSQMMTGAYKNWPRLVSQCFNFLEPNGYFEVHDIDFVLRCDDDSLSPDSALARWDKYMQEGANKAGFPLDAIPHVPDMMHRAGFVDIVATPTKWPINTWPKDKRYKELGKWVNENFIWGAESMCLALFTRALGWSIEEVQVFAAAMRNDLRNRKIHAYWNLWVIHGRKPQ
jgi:hypothetical protein